MSGLTAEEIAAKMNARNTSTTETSGRGSPVVNTLANAGDLAGINYTSGGEDSPDDKVPPFGSRGAKTQKGVDEEEAGRVKEGGVLHWLGLAGGRKRRRKKSRKSKRKKSRKGGRRRKSRRKKRRKSKKRKSRRRRKKSRRRRR